MTVYELNQIAYNSLPNMENGELKDSLPYIQNYLRDHYGKYYIMLNNDKHYYTILTHDTDILDNWEFKMAREIIACAKELGPIKSIEEDEVSGALEVWILQDEEVHAYHIFKYDQGVIEV